MKRFVALSLFILGFSPIVIASGNALPAHDPQERVRVLLVVAHPDDEYEVAGTVYRISKELLGTVDQLIITNGEAGYRYSSLASPYYGVDLTNEAVGRAQLPRIRRKEAQQAGRVLGIRRQWFLNETDDRFTLDAREVLNQSWHTERVVQALEEHLRKGHYDFLFVLLPDEQTHGEHKAASILALQAVGRLPADQRPIVLGAQAGGSEYVPYKPLLAYSLTDTTSPSPQFQFDRDARFGYHESLSYQIVVDWVIAEHKSQGLFQTRCQQDRFERFWLFSVNRSSAKGEAASLFARVEPNPRPERGTEITGASSPARR
jgi:N-acetylglucosamine malate deacetylase 2